MKKIFLIVLCSSFAVNVGAIQIQGIPFFKQGKYQCGPAALASVISFYGLEVDEALITEETYTEALKGSLITDLENYAKRVGFQTKAGQGSIDVLKEFILDRKPVLYSLTWDFGKFQNPIILLCSALMKTDLSLMMGKGRQHFLNMPDLKKAGRRWAILFWLFIDEADTSYYIIYRPIRMFLLRNLCFE